MRIRCLRASDVTQEYIDSLNNEKKYIENKMSIVTLGSQREYVAGIEKSPDRLILGLFHNKELIGTSGAQSISVSCFTLGILVFDHWRGKGMGKLLVWMACKFLNEVMNVQVVNAGIKHDNLASLNSFLNCGFSIKEIDRIHHKLELLIENLKQPSPIVLVSQKIMTTDRK